MNDRYQRDPFAADDLVDPFDVAPQRRPRRLWGYLAAGAILVLIVGAIVWLTRGNHIARPAPEVTVRAYYEATEALDFETAGAYIDPTAPSRSVSGLGLGRAWSRFSELFGEDIQAWLVEDLNVDQEMFPTLAYSDFTVERVVVNRDLALVDVEFNVQVDVEDVSVQLPQVLHVRKRHTLRWYDDQWYIEP